MRISSRRLVLTLVVLLAGFISCAVPRGALAAGCLTYSQALAQCTSDGASNPFGAGWKFTGCVVVSSNANGGGLTRVYQNISSGATTKPDNYGYCGALPPSTACTTIPTVTISLTGQWSVGKQFPQHVSDPVTGASVTCMLSVSAIGAPTLNPYDGKWYSRVTLAPNANPAGGNTSQDGTVSNGDGSTPSPAIPSVPTPVPTTSQPSPKVCNGGSCYDLNTDSYIAVDGNGNQISVPGSAARGSGSCITSGDSAACAGSSPPSPPSSAIPDPVASHTGSDQYTQINPVTGSKQTVVVNTYTNPGAPGTTNGQKPGDSGPASSSSTGSKSGDGTTSSGGGDCNTPPLVNGSGGMSAIAFQTWKTRCDIESQGGNKLGTGTVNSLGDLYTPSTDTTQSVVGEFQSSVMQTPIAGAATNFFNVGAVGGSCPTWTLAATDWNAEQTFDFYCRPEADEALDMARVVLLIVCAYVAFQIAMGDS